MSKYNEKGLTMDNWHKCPNSLVDRLMGTVLSPTATCVVLTVWRLTEGVRERHQAAIPTETFMRVTKTNRKKTAYDYVNEAIKTGLINVKKERGKVNVYSINKKCPLWYAAEVVAESVPSTESATGGDNCHIVVAESATGLDESSGGKCHTYKDIPTKDNTKDKKKETESELAKKQIDESAELLVEFWNSNHGKGKSADVKPSVWVKTAKARLKNFTVDEIKTAMLSVIQSTWHQQSGQVLIKNAISSDQRCDEAISRYHQAQHTNHQGNNNASQQPRQSQSNTYADRIDAQLAAESAATMRTVNQGEYS